MIPYNWRYISRAFCTLLVLHLFLATSHAREEEKTYAISLEKTAEIEEDIRDIEGRKVLTKTVTVQKGQWVWKILRERGLLKKDNMSQVISILKKLNKSLENIDLIHPGEKIVIPLKISPIARGLVPGRPTEEKIISIAELKDMNFDDYTVRAGDNITRIATGLYDVPLKETYDEYLKLVRKLNPTIKDLNLIYPGQVIRLPIYSPEVVRKLIEPTAPPKPGKPEDEDRGEDRIVNQRANSLGHDVALIFSEMGEEWVQSGKHFIPLKSGGQINLEAGSYPVINLRSGLRVIVDLNNRLPGKLADLIASNWGNYRIVHITAEDDLKSLLDKTIRTCDYPKVFKNGESLEFEGDISFKITGDWIIKLDETGSNDVPRIVVINLMEANSESGPRMIRDYLEKLGVKIIDYPEREDEFSEGTDKAEILEGGDKPSSLIRTILNLAGKNFSTDVEIPVYQSRKADLKMVIKADFFLKVNGKDAIISLSELGPEVISFLKDHRFLTLSLTAETKPLAMVAKTLEFLDIKFDPGPHSFTVIKGKSPRNIKLTLPGNAFSDTNGKSILATPLSLPDEISLFLSQRGYKILVLPSLSTAAPQDS